MTHRNDDKRNSLLTLLVLTDGDTNDLEKTWLLSAITVPVSAHVNDLWMELFTQEGATATEWNDAANEWLGGLLYTGALPDRWSAYWAAGGGI